MNLQKCLSSSTFHPGHVSDGPQPIFDLLDNRMPLASSSDISEDRINKCLGGFLLKKQTKKIKWSLF